MKHTWKVVMRETSFWPQHKHVNIEVDKVTFQHDVDKLIVIVVTRKLPLITTLLVASNDDDDQKDLISSLVKLFEKKKKVKSLERNLGEV